MHQTTEVTPEVWLSLHHTDLIIKGLCGYVVCPLMALESMTDTMGRMHSDAQFAGSSSVKPCGLFLLRTSAIQTSLITLGLASVPAHVEMMGFLGIGNNPMVG